MYAVAVMVLFPGDAALSDGVSQQIKDSGDCDNRPQTRRAYRKCCHNVSTVAARNWGWSNPSGRPRRAAAESGGHTAASRHHMFLVTSNTARAIGAVITMAAKSRRTRVCRRAAAVEASSRSVQQASCAS